MKKSIGKKVLTMALALGVVCSLDGCMGNNSWMGSTEWTETMTEAATETGTAAQADNSEAAGSGNSSADRVRGGRNADNPYYNRREDV